MPEYVYALHDFIPENPDEVPFKAGDRIEVIEKDDLYQDGWWQGRNPQGRAGLFPQSYTTTSPPATSPPAEAVRLPTVTFPQAAASPPRPTNGALPEVSPEMSPALSSDDRERTLSQGERTMQATLTDVQQAIEQLGRNAGDAASFSFASSHGDYSEREDEEPAAVESEDDAFSHRGVRQLLAARAQQENEERQAREGSGSAPTTPLRLAHVDPPPIDFEFSDESEGEGEEEALPQTHNRRSTTSPDRRFSSQYPHIPEEDEAVEEAEASVPRSPSATQVATALTRDDTIVPSLPSAALTPPSGVVSHPVESENGHIEPSEDFIVPSPSVVKQTHEEQEDPATATADRLTFPDAQLTDSPDPSSVPSTVQSTYAMPTPIPPAAPSPLLMPEVPLTVVAREPVLSAIMPGSLNPLSPVSPEHASTTPIPVAPAMTSASSTRSTTAPTIKPTPIKVYEPVPFLARSAASSPGRAAIPSPGIPLPSPTATNSSAGYGSTSGIQQTLTPATTMSFKTAGESATHQEVSPVGSQEGYRRSSTHPSEWTMEEVIEWLRAKGFDEGVVEKFIEQEITGDVLLELDANTLKVELGIQAFGKRVRIVNAIAELRRPPSFSDEHPMPSAGSHTASRAHSFNYGHSHSSSMASSAQQSYAGSPMYAPTGFSYPSHGGFSPAGSQRGIPPPSASTLASSGFGESPRHATMPDISASPSRNGWRASDPGAAPPMPVALPAPASEVNLSTPRMREAEPIVPQEPVPLPAPELVGLGLGFPAPPQAEQRPEPRPVSPPKLAPPKNRPGSLVLSQSDANLKVKAIGGDDVEAEERTAMSDSESTKLDAKAKRRRLFGRSTESASIKEKAPSVKDNASRHSKESSPAIPAQSPNPSEAASDVALIRRRPSKKKGSEEKRHGDRLSLFGGSFSGTLGKGRKPVPKLSISEKSEKGEKGEKGEKPEKAEKEKGDHESIMSQTFHRMRHPSGRRTGRPSTSDGIAMRERDQGSERESEPEGKSRSRVRPPPSLRDKSREREVLRKRTSSTSDVTRSPAAAAQAMGAPPMKPGKSVLAQIGAPDHNGWIRKKNDQFNSWRNRYCVLKGPHLYVLKSNDKSETKIKGYINVVGYKVVADENVDPGRYGFKIIHDSEKTHFFSHDEQFVIREWMKALMKATISRDFATPVMSSSNIPTIPLAVAQTMNPSPRPPSPTARAATQRAHRRDNPNQLSSRDAQILMGMPKSGSFVSNGDSAGERPRVESFFTSTSGTSGASSPPLSEPPSKKKPAASPKVPAPPRPTRETRRKFSTGSATDVDNTTIDPGLIEWANAHLPEKLKITDAMNSLCSGLALLRLAEDIKGKPASPPVPDSAFPTGPNDDRLDGLFRLFDFLLDNDVKMGTVSINDIRQGKREKVVQLLYALRAWEDKRNNIALALSQDAVAPGATFMAGGMAFRT
ncbi:hypothetical protein PsYK624_035840 [Phanerochaete sordida]|uniref:Uncharacterized protein n=1 Tax=Phanerochaete sordida TaxID=48140 RepID=A0A9P3G3B9_9APHY|nr:hypothetical protein PsYK624_035840 [Phanerochaete sordida]